LKQEKKENNQMPKPELPKVHCLINLYNEYATLPLCLSSGRDIFSSFIVADGAYKKYFEFYKKKHPKAEVFSTDGSLELLHVIPNLPPVKLIMPPGGKPWLNQCVKRTAMLDAVPDGEWFYILDADEMLYGEARDGFLDIMGSGCIAGSSPIYNPGLDISVMSPVWHPRLFLKVPGMFYDRKHWLLKDYAGRVVEKEYPTKWTDQFVLAHLKVFKERGRLMPHLGYMKTMSIDGWIEPHSKQFNIRTDLEKNA